MGKQTTVQKGKYTGRRATGRRREKNEQQKARKEEIGRNTRIRREHLSRLNYGRYAGPLAGTGDTSHAAFTASERYFSDPDFTLPLAGPLHRLDHPDH